MGELIGKGLKILILDDEGDIRRFSKEFFQRRGFAVTTASTGQSAISFVKKTRFDIAILDIHLLKGNKSGIDVLKFIREARPDCFCLMLTRDNDQKTMDETTQLGAYDYLVKPLTLKKVETAIKKVVKKIGKGAK
jgi:DNA-binding response OmpR family regulator